MRSVVITGAGSGIGRATALRLDARGWRVFAGVLGEEEAAELRSAGSERLTPLQLDVTDAEQIGAAAEQIAAQVGEAGLEGLVNNAGVAVPSPLETLPIDDLRRQLEVNLVGQVAVTQALLPQIRAARGRIVFLSSIGGLVALPLTGAYHASKFGIEAVGDVFRCELRRWGISVSIIEPGVIATPIWERGGRAADEIGTRSPGRDELYGKAVKRQRELLAKANERGIPAEKVAATIEQALAANRPRVRYLVGPDAKAQARLRHLVPTRVLDRIYARVMGL